MFLFQGYSRKGSALAYLGRLDDSIKAYEEGLLHEPDNAQLKVALKGVRAQKIGNKGMANPFAVPDLFVKLRSDPRTRAYLDDPDYIKLVQDLQSNPSNVG
jgi:stress-induced-phosphoprotein 1